MNEAKDGKAYKNSSSPSTKKNRTMKDDTEQTNKIEDLHYRSSCLSFIIL